MSTLHLTKYPACSLVTMRGLFCLQVSSFLYNGLQVRSMATTVDKGLLSKLRKRTGISFINCKKALEQFENDLEKAEMWLKEQAQKEGWAKATKLQSRSMSNGLIAVISNQQAATMIEVNCETDFVARNSKFINLTARLAQDCHRTLLQKAEPALGLDKAVGSLVAADGRSLADHVALEVGNIGENMLLRRTVHLKGNSSYLSTYLHASGPEIRTNSDCHFGKYGVIISLSRNAVHSREESEGQSLEELGHMLGQHIVGMNPRVVGSLADEDVEDVDENEGGNEEEERLVFQEFLLDPSMSVGELLKRNGVVVNRFYRFACGEELLEDEKEK